MPGPFSQIQLTLKPYRKGEEPMVLIVIIIAEETFAHV